jgi:hypothetical protein
MSARAARVGRLAVEMAAAFAEGDVEGALAVHESIGRLMATPTPVAPHANEGAAGDIVDLARERELRGR